MIRRIATAAALAISSAALVCLGSGTAGADTGSATVTDTAAAATRSITLHCGASGFNGYMELDMTSSGSYLWYKITKGSNKGGNHANIYFSDGGINPILNLANNDNGVQDGYWHLYYGPYTRGYGGLGVEFVFDRSNASDPRCTKNGVAF